MVDVLLAESFPFLLGSFVRLLGGGNDVRFPVKTLNKDILSCDILTFKYTPYNLEGVSSTCDVTYRRCALSTVVSRQIIYASTIDR